ncbi:hypothetical protein ACFELO_01940 [Oceanicaulis sp. LC35]|uniref:hypothetical protein n=1 Tax=Oceanicaulis sp. LC35 TaxID=3349635 RepID=UPI003F8468D3
MIIRLFMGLIVAPIAAIGALYGLSMVVESTPGVYGALQDEPAPAGDDTLSEPGDETMGEPPLALPYDAGGAAAFLATLFEGDEPYWLDGADSRADLASVSAQIAQPGSGGEAECTPSHVQLHCTLRLQDGYGYGFALQNREGEGWTVVDDDVRLLNNS